MSSKTNLFFKVISFIIMQSFLITNISFAAGGNFFVNSEERGCLSPEMQIPNQIMMRDFKNQTIIKGDLSQLTSILPKAIIGEDEAYEQLKRLALTTPETLIEYFEAQLPEAIEAMTESMFGKGFGYDVRGNAWEVASGEVDLTPLSCYLIGKALATRYAEQGEGVEFTGDQRIHTPMLRLALSLGAQSAGAKLFFSDEIVGTGEHGILSGENPNNVKVMGQVSGSHGIPAKNGFKLKVIDPKTGQLEPLYGKELANLYTLIKSGNLRTVESFIPLTEQNDLIEKAVDAYDKTLPQVSVDQPVVFDCRNSALTTVLKKIVEKRGLKNVFWLNDTPDGRMPGGIWDPSKPEALVACQNKVLEINASGQFKKKAIGFVFDGDGDRAAAILEDGRAVPSFEMTLPFYQRLFSDPINQEVMNTLINAGFDKIWAITDIRANSRLKNMFRRYSDWITGKYITTGYPPQRAVVRHIFSEIEKYVAANPSKFDAGFAEKLRHFKTTYFTAEASGHQFFHICPNYPEKVIDAGIAVAFNLLHIKETIQDVEAKDEKVGLSAGQDSYLLTELFDHFPPAISSGEVRIVVPNSIKFEVTDAMIVKLKEKYADDFLPTPLGTVDMGDYLLQDMDEGKVEVAGFLGLLKTGGSFLFRVSNTGEQCTLIFEGGDIQELIRLMEEMKQLVLDTKAEFEADASTAEAAKNIKVDDLEKEIQMTIEAAEEITPAAPIVINTATLQADSLGALSLSNGEIADVNRTMEGIQRTMQFEDNDVTTELGRQRLLKNWRGWVFGEQEWANQGIEDTVTVAQKVRDDNPEAFVVVGVGGSDQTTKGIVNANISTQHNLLSKEARGGAPMLFYTGDGFDPNSTYDTLQVLDEKGILFKTKFNIISKSGTTGETAHAFLVIKSYLEVRLEQLAVQYAARQIKDKDLEAMGLTAKDLEKVTLNYTVKLDAGEEAVTEETFRTGRFFVFTTGLNDKSALYNYVQLIREQAGDDVFGLLPVPDGTGGRYSFGTAVGMLAMGVMANTSKGETPESRIRQVLEAIKDVRNEILNGSVEGDNVPSFAIARANYLAEKHGLGTVAIYPFANMLQEFANLMMQLSTESIREKGQGQNILPLVGPSRNHSVVNGIINGPRDTIICFIEVAAFDPAKDATITGGKVLGGSLMQLEQLKQSDIQKASLDGTLKDAIEKGVPAYKITIPALTPYYVAKLIAYFEHEVAIEGMLRGLREPSNAEGVYVDLTYLQSSVEGYKAQTRAILSEIRAAKFGPVQTSANRDMVSVVGSSI
ncbi:MAG: hypothetical protein ABII88_05355 [Candidatus Omnitrophota bacterium]